MLSHNVCRNQFQIQNYEEQRIKFQRTTGINKTELKSPIHDGENNITISRL
jgi:hypothetical protein